MGRKWLDNYRQEFNYNELIPIAQNGRNLKRLLNDNIKSDSNINLNYTKRKNIDPGREIKNNNNIVEGIQNKYNVSRNKALEIKQKLETQKYINKKIDNSYEIKPGEDQSFLSKSWEVLTNPATAASYWLNDQRIPDRFSKGERNNLDIATDLFNPFGIVDSAKNAVKETISIPKNLYNSEYGEAGSNFLNAGLNTLSVVPALRELKGAKPLLKGKLQKLKINSKYFNPEFKSEIDWAKWNKEIPENTQLMKEYNTIEQTSKANGTWMKNSDGSKFKGTPEQFVQQNSQNFKRAFGDAPNIAYRGQTRPTEIIGGGNRGYAEGISYLGDKDQALTYAETWKHPRHSGKIYQPGLSDPNAPALYELMYPNSTNTKIITHSEPRNWQKLIDDDVASQMDEAYLNFRGKSNTGEQFINTDDIGTYVAKNNLDHAYISNIMDYNRKPSRKFFNLLPGKNVGNTVIMNSKPGNYLKSRWYNNGMFDMTNPNIYKTLVPGVVGLGALQQKRNGGGIIKDNNGYWNPDNWGKVVEIDSNDITMKGVNQPLLGISDEGDVQYMEPNKDYKFKGKKVREFPIARNGINNLDENSLQQLDQLTNFTNYNKLSNGGWLDKF